MAVMEALLFRHPLLDPFAGDLSVAMEWAAEIARRNGMTADQAAERLRAAMFYGGPECPSSTQTGTSTSKSGSTAFGANAPTAPS